ncbi:MAG: hypothetical protein ACI9WS_000265 [Paraglaciecola psychrophila]|jgi:hypothetical protein
MMKNLCYTPIDLRENDRREIDTQISDYLKKGGQIENIGTSHPDLRLIRKAAGIAQFRDLED